MISAKASRYFVHECVALHKVRKVANLQNNFLQIHVAIIILPSSMNISVRKSSITSQSAIYYFLGSLHSHQSTLEIFSDQSKYSNVIFAAPIGKQWKKSSNILPIYTKLIDIFRVTTNLFLSNLKNTIHSIVRFSGSLLLNPSYI